MVQLLLGLFPQAPFRNVALQCLTEVRAGPAPRAAADAVPPAAAGCCCPCIQPPCKPACMQPGHYTLYKSHNPPQVASLTMDESFDERFQGFFKVFSTQLFQILPPGARADRLCWLPG